VRTVPSATDIPRAPRQGRDEPRRAPAANGQDRSEVLGYGEHVDIKIGIINSPREIAFESKQTEEIEKAVSEALSSQTHLALQDEKGRKYVVAAAALAYVEFGSEEARRIGFVA
jgi:hypothetical protein